MTKTVAWMLALALVGTLASAQETTTGDELGRLIPRSGTLTYAVSERPDVFYRLFGKDDAGQWKLRSFLTDKMKEEKATEDQTRVFNYVFDQYEALDRVELGLLDVTLDGPKYVLVLTLKQGAKFDLKPEFLKEYINEELTYAGQAYTLYRLPQNGSDGDAEDTRAAEKPEDPEDAEETEDDGPDDMGPGDDEDFREEEFRGEERPRRQTRFGMDRYYVANLDGKIVITNFDSAMVDVIELHKDATNRERLSDKGVFQRWRKDHKPTDLSVMFIGRELHNLVERVMPSEAQAGVDTQKIYRAIDEWVQLRSYDYFKMDMSYHDATRALEWTVGVKLRRENKLLKTFSVAPKDFRLKKFIPSGTGAIAGTQLGDATKTWDNVLGFLRDMETVRNEAGDAIDRIEPEEMREESLDEALEKLDKMLADWGTSTKDILNVLGSEAVLFVKPDETRALDVPEPGVLSLIRASDVGVLIDLKDMAKAKQLLINAREKDPEGAFQSFEEQGYKGVIFNVSSERPYAWALHDNALMIVAVMESKEQDFRPATSGLLKQMVDASQASNPPVLPVASRFATVDIGVYAKLFEKVQGQQAERVDVYTRPPLGADNTKGLHDVSVSVWSNEAPDALSVTLHVTGLPDFGQLLGDGFAIMGGSDERSSYTYTENNLFTVTQALRDLADDDSSTVDFDSLLKVEGIRKGHLQTPFDSRFEGDAGELGWTSLDEMARDENGNLPEWVDAEVAKLVESNEAKGWNSYTFVTGDIKSWIKAYKRGFIVMYQTKAETLGGHFVVYADGSVGWLSAAALTKALEMNKKGEAVPATDPWESREGAEPVKPEESAPNPWGTDDKRDDDKDRSNDPDEDR